MTGPRIRTVGAAAIAAAMLVAFSGCDSSENADTANGRALFVAKCGQCHALAESGQAGQIGPDLDAAFAAARNAGMDNDTIEGVVKDQIEHPRQTDESDPTYMPANIVTGTDVDDVSAYVASVAGVPGIEPPIAPGGPGGQVFADNGCGGCHVLAAAESVGAVGPNLDEEIAGWTPEEVETAIVDPNSEIAQGFSAGIMPDNYGDTIEAADLKLLVKWLSEEAGAPQPKN